MRDEVHAKTIAVDFVDGEADALERHGPLRREVASQIVRDLEHEPLRAGICLGLDESRDAVDVAGDVVSAKRGARAQRALEVDRMAGYAAAERRAGERLGRHVRGEGGAGQSRHGEAGTRDRDAVTDLRVGEERATGIDEELDVAAAFGERADGTHRLDDSGEHQRVSRRTGTRLSLRS